MILKNFVFISFVVICAANASILSKVDVEVSRQNDILYFKGNDIFSKFIFIILRDFKEKISLYSKRMIA